MKRLFKGEAYRLTGYGIKTHFSPVTVASSLPQSEAGRFRYSWFLEPHISELTLVQYAFSSV
ncbi:MAG: hypothetical protein LBJ00_01960 [Planctomycetaceae bacterium]|nr:hypothetical protein [Planctomycetaceae bacterium]